MSLKLCGLGEERCNAVGGLLRNKPIICGGFFPRSRALQECKVLGQPVKKFNMLQKTMNASSVVLNQERLWITGGTGKLSTELISLDQHPVKGPDFPFGIIFHSMIQVNSKTIFIIGGSQNHKTSNETWIIDPTKKFELKSGPKLNVARHLHSCSKMNINGKIHVVVAGGVSKNEKHLDSVELLDISSPNQSWTIGT